MTSDPKKRRQTTDHLEKFADKRFRDTARLVGIDGTNVFDGIGKEDKKRIAVSPWARDLIIIIFFPYSSPMTIHCAGCRNCTSLQMSKHIARTAQVKLLFPKTGEL